MRTTGASGTHRSARGARTRCPRLSRRRLLDLAPSAPPRRPVALAWRLLARAPRYPEAPMSAWDVIVAGAGNAGLSAAHAARERGARVLVLEKADEAWSGGNSAFTAGAIRFAHGGLDDVRSLVEEDERLAATDLDPYSAEDFAAD